MKEIFRHKDVIKVGHYKSVLEEAGIACLLRNEAVAGTEVPIPEFYPALNVVDEADEQRAVKILRDYIKKESEEVKGENIHCSSCNEESPANFEICWACEASLV